MRGERLSGRKNWPRGGREVAGDGEGSMRIEVGQIWRRKHDGQERQVVGVFKQYSRSVATRPFRSKGPLSYSHPVPFQLRYEFIEWVPLEK